MPIVYVTTEEKPHVGESELTYRHHDHSRGMSTKGVNRELEKALLRYRKALALNPPDEELEQSADQPRRAGDR